jgi:hypothetical protein
MNPTTENNTRLVCDACGTEFTLAAGREYAQEHGHSAEVVMCNRCQAVFSYVATPSYAYLLFNIKQKRNTLLKLTAVAVLALLSFSLLPWTGSIYDHADDAVAGKNGKTLSGLELVTSESGDYPFAQNTGVLVVLVGLVCIFLSLLLSMLTLRYEPLLPYLRFGLAVLVVLGCLWSIYHTYKNTASSGGFSAQFQGQDDPNLIATCTSTANGNLFCTGESSRHRYPNYGLIIILVSAIIILVNSQLPRLDDIRRDMQIFRESGASLSTS